MNIKIIAAIFLGTALRCFSQTPYSPATDANLLTWLKADALALTNNAAVSNWVPSGGTMNQPLGQTVSSNQPMFQTMQRNGLPAVLFDGVSSYLTNGAPVTPAAPQPLTFFIVYKYVGPLNTFQNYYIGSIPNTVSWAIGNVQGSNAAYAGAAFASTVPIDINWHMLMIVLNGSNSIYRIDGGATAAVNGNPGTGGTTSLEIGGQAGNNALANVYVGEILIYNGNQSTNEAAIFNYLDGRWGIIEMNQYPPFTFNWPDRRPIGMDVLGGSSFVTPTNPRGWFSLGGADITTSNGLAAFQSQLLARAASEVSILTNMNAQGVIVWDSEGYEITGLTYVGDPRAVPLMAPELDAVADKFFAIYTNAGLRVGMTIRPHSFGVGTNLPAGTNGNLFVLANAPYGQKGYYYSNGWTQQTITWQMDQVNTQSYWPDLLSKIQYARNRWGCTLFYIDSYVELDNFGPTSAGFLANILQASPGILLIPEVASVASTATRLFAMSAPYLQPQYTGYFVPTNVLSFYPNAIGVININPPYTNSASLEAGVLAGNILLINSWWPNSLEPALTRAYIDAGLMPTNLHLVTNQP